MTNYSLYKFASNMLPQSIKKIWNKVNASDLGSRMARGALWSLGGAVISRGLMLIASILVARILGRDIYGEFGMIRNTLNMFLVFAGFGLGMTATKYIAEFRVSNPERAGRVLAISGLFAGLTGALVALGLYIFSSWIAIHTINAPHLGSELKIGAFILMLNALNGAQTGALAGFEAFKTIAKINLYVGFASFPLLIFGAYHGGLHGAVLALGANMAINWLLNHLALRRMATRHNIPFTFKKCITEWPILWKFSLPAALGGMMVSPILWGCNAFLVNQPGGYGQMGIYDAANQWQSAILFVPGVVGQIVLPVLANLNGINDKKKYQKALKYNTLLNGAVAIVVAFPVILFAPFIMRCYGQGFEDGVLALSILSISTILISLNNVVGQAIASKGQMWLGFMFNIMWAIVILSLSWLFIHNGYGVTGLALANAIAYFLHSIWQSLYIFKGNRFSTT